MKFIGMDVHSSTTDICVLNSKGQLLRRARVETQQKPLLRFIKRIEGRKCVALEESTLADWVTRALQPHVEKVVRCEPRHNRLISHSEDKCDVGDAHKIAILLWMGQLKEVHHPSEKYRKLRTAVRHDWRSSRDLTRAKNRLKALFRFEGVEAT